MFGTSAILSAPEVAQAQVRFFVSWEPVQRSWINYKIFCKIWSILLTSVDNGIENNDCFG